MIDLEKIIDMWMTILFATILTVVGFAATALMLVGTLEMVGLI